MSKEVYPVGSKVRVTKVHPLTWDKPWPVKGEIVTIIDHHPCPHGYGVEVDVYVAKNDDGARVYLHEDCIEQVVEPLPKGTLVFVTQTHKFREDFSTIYAGRHMIIDSFSSGHYWAKDVQSKCMFAVSADKIAPVEFEEIYPPAAPSVVGEHGQVVYHGKGTEYEGYWKYSTYWGWSNFVATNPYLYRKQAVGAKIGTVGVLAEQ